jgi:solute carrier family 36 (proton-coupled amino acid transporter)
MSMYAFEGQTMILPIENKLDNPDDFLDNFGVLPTTMCLCTIFMTAIGFFGYNAFGHNVAETITVNVPHTGYNNLRNLKLYLMCFQSLLSCEYFSLYSVNSRTLNCYVCGFRHVL